MHIDPRSLKQIVIYHVTYPHPNRAEDTLVGRTAIDLHGVSDREKLFRQHADDWLPLVDKSDTEYRHEVRTFGGMTQVLSRLIIRQPNGNYWKIAHYS